MRPVGDFYGYLVWHRNMRTPVGDLARDILRDPCFPVYNYSLDNVLYHLSTHKAPKYKLDAVKEAHEVWSNLED